MRAFFRRSVTLSLGIVLAGCAGQARDATGGEDSKHDLGAAALGTVHFPVSCTPESSQQMERGLALLHNMMYEDASLAFTTAGEADPECGMAYWGRAMTLIHPLWSEPPSEEKLAEGRALIAEARSRGQKTDREQAYIAALASYYEADAPSGNEAPRLRAFAEGWERARAQFPDDPEVAAFTALAMIATSSPGDKTYARQQQAGAIVEELLERIPDHPGAHHYIIHAYDYPPLAKRALEVARSYGNLAPEVAHPLHMPTHIFTRLGLWQESIDWNTRSAEAAWQIHTREVGSLHHLHALDYLAYAYLQQARDQKAHEVLEQLRGVEGEIGAFPGSAYPLAAVPARYAVERQEWRAAANLEARVPSTFAWDRFPQFEAITHFARALGAARSGDPQAGRNALDTLAALGAKLPATGPGAYWAQQVAIQSKAALAWVLYAEGKQAAAIATMREAAAMEAATEKHPVTPGEVLPASELLGDMLMVVGQPAKALAAYRTALERSPGRFNSLYGAGRAAEESGDRVTATTYYRQLLEITAGADSDRPALRHAKAFVESQRA